MVTNGFVLRIEGLGFGVQDSVKARRGRRCGWVGESEASDPPFFSISGKSAPTYHAVRFLDEFVRWKLTLAAKIRTKVAVGIRRQPVTSLRGNPSYCGPSRKAARRREGSISF